MKELEHRCPRCSGRTRVTVQQGAVMLVTGGPTFRVALQGTVMCTGHPVDGGSCGWTLKSSVIEAIFEWGD